MSAATKSQFASSFGKWLLAKVIEMNVTAGQTVLKDQILVKLDDADLQTRQSLDDELQRPADAGPGEMAHVNGHSNGNGHVHHSNGNDHANSNGHASSDGQQPRMEVARATQSQIRAIFGITKRQGLDPNVLVRDKYRVHRIDDLSIREASALIEELKNGRTEVRS